ncbi:MAG: sigma-54-dependent Fis family transcriptional regulator [Proteobacteria bacterium]|nr:sigma-54-dependent Fis family transcriptional regulator [Pseudomonadota bacterium]
MLNQKKTSDVNTNTNSGNNPSIHDDPKFFALANLLPETVFVTDTNGTVVFLNQAGIKIFGCSPVSTSGGFTLDMFFVPEQTVRLKKNLNCRDDLIQEYTALKDDGSTFSVLLHTHHMFENNSFTGIIGMIADLSDRQALQKKLLRAEQKWRDIFRNTWEFWVLCDLECNIIESSITHSTIHNEEFNISESELLGLNIMDFLHDDLKHIMKRNLKEVINQGKLKGIEHIKLKDGEERSFEFNQVLVYEDEKPVAIRILAREVTAEIAAKKSLEISETRYRSVFENTGLPTIILENDLLISMVNVKFEELVGYRKGDIQGKMTLPQIIVKDTKQSEINRFFDLKNASSFEMECRIISHHGDLFDMIMKVGTISGTDQKVVSFTDITSRKQVEVNLLESSAQLQKENILLRSSMKERYRFGNIIGKCHVMQDMYESIVNAAETNANVVLYGESGTGKELVAREIHQMSSRKKHMFVAVNCGAIPENIIESEFFGYKKGAFTGAYTDKPGYLDFADGGTLFLDEVGEINLSMQVKLLRIIDSGDYIPLGSNASKKTNVRIIAATNSNLRELIKEGSIREDFFYRIHIIPIHLPPLRDRKEDIPLLIDHFMKMHGDSNKDVERILIDQFLDYDWPGNVRELQNVVHRYISMKKIDFSGSPRTKQNPLHISPMQGDQHLSIMLDLYEKEIIKKTLSKYQWHRGKAAEALGINRKTLFTKMMKHGVESTRGGAK